MTDYKKLYDGIGKAAWGYLFIYFNINLGTVNILPTFVGYLLFLSAIKHLSGEERELKLLETLGAILMIWHLASWIASFAAIDLDGMLQVVDIIIGIINIYFHFQLLTNLASIAAKYQHEGDELDKRILNCRTFQTVMLTAVIILLYLTKWLNDFGIYASTLGAILYLIAGVILMKTLFDLRRCFAEKTEEENA